MQCPILVIRPRELALLTTAAINNILLPLRNEFEVDEIVGADGLVGWDTRAFKMVQRTEYVLKDICLEDGRKLELEIHRKPLEDINTSVGIYEEVIAIKLLLTPKDHSKVIINGQDRMCKVMMRGAIPSFDNTFVLAVAEDSINYAARSVALSLKGVRLGTCASRDDTRKHIRHRTHCRVMASEVAEPIHKVMNLRGGFVSLKDCTEVLNYMHKAGWVHRDMSRGNVNLYKGHEFLGSLEYSKRTGMDGKHEVRIGTLDFIAVEVANRAYFHSVPAQSKVERNAYRANIFKILSEPDISEEGGIDPDSDINDLIKAEAIFFYNDLHDMESIWWISIWMLFFHDNEAQRATDGLSYTETSIGHFQLFPRDLNISDRTSFLVSQKSYLKAMSCLPKSFARVTKLLGHLRGLLVRMYKDSEASLPKFDRDVYKDELHGFFDDTWDACVEVAGESKLIPYHGSSLKRKATDAGSTDGIDELFPTPAPKARRKTHSTS